MLERWQARKFGVINIITIIHNQSSLIYQKLTETELKNEDWERKLIGTVGTSAAPGVDQSVKTSNQFWQKRCVVSANQVD